MTRIHRRRLPWLALGAVVAAATLAPVGLADKPQTTGKDKPKPVASEKTWVKLGGGKAYGTYLKLDSGFANALGSAGVAAAPLGPASDPNDNPDMGIRFPITQGKLVLTFNTATPAALIGVRGTVGHVGGLKLTKGSTVVRVRNFVVVANKSATDTSKLTAQVNGKRIDFANLTFTAWPSIAGKNVTVENVTVKLSSAAATALSQAFGASFAADTMVGSATVKARLVGKGKS